MNEKMKVKLTDNHIGCLVTISFDSGPEPGLFLGMDGRYAHVMLKSNNRRYSTQVVNPSWITAIHKRLDIL